MRAGTLVWILASVAVTTTVVPTARAQSPASPAVFSNDLIPPPPAEALADPTPGDATLEDRFQKLEQRYQDMERRHEDAYRSLSERYEQLLLRLGGGGTRGPGTEDPASDFGFDGMTSSRSGPNEFERFGISAEGTEGRSSIREQEASGRKRRSKVEFDEGIEFSSDDGEFKLTIHNLTQAEFRAFPTKDLGTLEDQFFIPRQRWYISGQATKNVEFYTVINRGYGSLDVLDAFITLNISQSLTDTSADEAGSGAQGAEGRTTNDRARGPDPRMRLRVGRMKTPYLYEYFSIAEGDLIAPERSIYAGNLAGNRQDGIMLLGDILDDQMTYAMGIFNGPRRSFQDFNTSKDMFLYLNSRPFLQAESWTALKYLNLGGSLYGGYQNNPAQPSVFTTANDETASNATAITLSPAFLVLNPNVMEQSIRLQTAAHLAYFYQSFMFLAEYACGFNGYGLNGVPDSTVEVPMRGYMFQAAYFVTGETLTRRVNVVRPLHDFGYTEGKFNYGAVEIHGRFSEMDIGNQIFNGGFADPTLWTNRVSATDIGVNWYLNYYTKIYFDWQHAMYATPITRGAGKGFMSTTDLFWLRFQLFF